MRAVAEHDFTGEEYYLAGHFPGNPIVPGVILTESLAQTCAVCAMAHPDFQGGLGLFAGIDEMRFRRIVRPGDTARFEVEMEKLKRAFGRARVRALVGEEVAAEGTITFVLQRP